MAVNPIPEGFHTITPSLVVKDAFGAIDFYKKVFRAEETSRMLSPDGKKVFHCALKFGDSTLFVYDEFPRMGMKAPEGLPSVTLYVYTKDTDKLYEAALEAGAKSTMAPADTFWGDRSASFIDPYGQSWSIATHTRDVSRPEMEKGGREAFEKMGADA
jgi:PhnB protein